MADPAPSTPALPAHVEETTRSIARLHAQHRRAATPFQKGVDRVTGFVARPPFMLGLTLLVLAWMAWNGLGAPLLRLAPFDPAPFAWLQGLAQLFAVYVTVSILATQRRETELAELRQQLTLELAILNEQKAAKMIQLIEALRRDSSAVEDRVDEEADAMASPNDPEAILAAIKDSHADLADSTDDLPPAAAPSPPRPASPFPA